MFSRLGSSLLDPVYRALGITPDEQQIVSPSENESPLLSNPAALDTTLPCHPLDPPPPYEDQDDSDEPQGKTWEITFEFISDPPVCKARGSLRPEIDWPAELVLHTRDLPGVMKHGLILSPENVGEEEGHVVHQYHPDGKEWSYSRSYTLVDSRWTGQLQVCAWDMRPVSKFRLNHLSADKVRLARVGDEEGDTVYYYNVNEPELAVNCIYDDMPMDGLWPWPKEE
ncbi:hypothetical protein ACHAPT_005641 [Fusarium lateritium]